MIETSICNLLNDKNDEEITKDNFNEPHQLSRLVNEKKTSTENS